MVKNVLLRPFTPRGSNDERQLSSERGWQSFIIPRFCELWTHMRSHKLKKNPPSIGDNQWTRDFPLAEGQIAQHSNYTRARARTSTSPPRVDVLDSFLQDSLNGALALPLKNPRWMSGRRRNATRKEKRRRRDEDGENSVSHERRRTFCAVSPCSTEKGNEGWRASRCKRGSRPHRAEHSPISSVAIPSKGFFCLGKDTPDAGDTCATLRGKINRGKSSPNILVVGLH